MHPRDGGAHVQVDAPQPSPTSRESRRRKPPAKRLRPALPSDDSSQDDVDNGNNGASLDSDGDVAARSSEDEVPARPPVSKLASPVVAPTPAPMRPSAAQNRSRSSRKRAIEAAEDGDDEQSGAEEREPERKQLVAIDNDEDEGGVGKTAKDAVTVPGDSGGDVSEGADVVDSEHGKPAAQKPTDAVSRGDAGSGSEAEVDAVRAPLRVVSGAAADEDETEVRQEAMTPTSRSPVPSANADEDKNVHAGEAVVADGGAGGDAESNSSGEGESAEEEEEHGNEDGEGGEEEDVDDGVGDDDNGESAGDDDDVAGAVDDDDDDGGGGDDDDDDDDFDDDNVDEGKEVVDRGGNNRGNARGTDGQGGAGDGRQLRDAGQDEDMLDDDDDGGGGGGVGNDEVDGNQPAAPSSSNGLVHGVGTSEAASPPPKVTPRPPGLAVDAPLATDEDLEDLDFFGMDDDSDGPAPVTPLFPSTPAADVGRALSLPPPAHGKGSDGNLLKATPSRDADGSARGSLAAQLDTDGDDDAPPFPPILPNNTRPPFVPTALSRARDEILSSLDASSADTSHLKGMHPSTVQLAKHASAIRWLLDRRAQILADLRRPLTQVRVPRQCEPMRRKSLWDYVLEEASWMANDVVHERRWKVSAARMLAYEAVAVVRARRLRSSQSLLSDRYPVSSPVESDDVSVVVSPAIETAGIGFSWCPSRYQRVLRLGIPKTCLEVSRAVRLFWMVVDKTARKLGPMTIPQRCAHAAQGVLRWTEHVKAPVACAATAACGAGDADDPQGPVPLRELQRQANIVSEVTLGPGQYPYVSPEKCAGLGPVRPEPRGRTLPLVDGAVSVTECGAFYDAHFRYCLQHYVTDAAVAALRPYQVSGLRWLHAMCHRGVSAVVADDRGLGKRAVVSCLVGLVTRVVAEDKLVVRSSSPLPSTAQSYVLLESGSRLRSALSSANARARGTLIVCPPTLVLHWMSELSAWTAGLSVRAAVSPVDIEVTLAGPLSLFDVIVTTPNAFRAAKAAFAAHSWRMCVVDGTVGVTVPHSAVVMPGSSESRARVRGSVDPPLDGLQELSASFRLFVTNRLMPISEAELAALVQFIAPGATGFPASSTDRRAAILPFVLRREIANVTIAKQLPRLRTRTIVIDEFPLQRDLRLRLTESDPAALARIAVACDKQPVPLAQVLVQLHALATHPALVRSSLNAATVEPLPSFCLRAGWLRSSSGSVGGKRLDQWALRLEAGSGTAIAFPAVLRVPMPKASSFPSALTTNVIQVESLWPSLASHARAAQLASRASDSVGAGSATRIPAVFAAASVTKLTQPPVYGADVRGLLSQWARGSKGLTAGCVSAWRSASLPPLVSSLDARVRAGYPVCQAVAGAARSHSTEHVTQDPSVPSFPSAPVELPAPVAASTNKSVYNTCVRLSGKFRALLHLLASKEKVVIVTSSPLAASLLQQFLCASGKPCIRLDAPGSAGFFTISELEVDRFNRDSLCRVGVLCLLASADAPTLDMRRFSKLFAPNSTPDATPVYWRSRHSLLGGDASTEGVLSEEVREGTALGIAVPGDADLVGVLPVAARSVVLFDVPLDPVTSSLWAVFLEKLRVSSALKVVQLATSNTLEVSIILSTPKNPDKPGVAVDAYQRSRVSSPTAPDFAQRKAVSRSLPLQVDVPVVVEGKRLGTTKAFTATHGIIAAALKACELRAYLKGHLSPPYLSGELQAIAVPAALSDAELTGALRCTMPGGLLASTVVALDAVREASTQAALCTDAGVTVWPSVSRKTMQGVATQRVSVPRTVQSVGARKDCSQRLDSPVVDGRLTYPVSQCAPERVVVVPPSGSATARGIPVKQYADGCDPVSLNVSGVVRALASQQDKSVLHYSRAYGPPNPESRTVYAPPAARGGSAESNALRLSLAYMRSVSQAQFEAAGHVSGAPQGSPAPEEVRRLRRLKMRPSAVVDDPPSQPLRKRTKVDAAEDPIGSPGADTGEAPQDAAALEAAAVARLPSDDRALHDAVSKFGTNWDLVLQVVRSNPGAKNQLRTPRQCFEQHRRLVASHPPVASVVEDKNAAGLKGVVLKDSRAALCPPGAHVTLPQAGGAADTALPSVAVTGAVANRPQLSSSQNFDRETDVRPPDASHHAVLVDIGAPISIASTPLAPSGIVTSIPSESVRMAYQKTVDPFRKTAPYVIRQAHHSHAAGAARASGVATGAQSAVAGAQASVGGVTAPSAIVAPVPRGATASAASRSSGLNNTTTATNNNSGNLGGGLFPASSPLASATLEDEAGTPNMPTPTKPARSRSKVVAAEDVEAYVVRAGPWWCLLPADVALPVFIVCRFAVCLAGAC